MIESFILYLRPEAINIFTVFVAIAELLAECAFAQIIKRSIR